MANEGYGFSKGDAGRIKRTVRAHEQQPGDLMGKARPRPQPTPRFFITLGEESETDAGHYKWTSKDTVQAGAFVAVSPAITSGADYTAREINQTSGIPEGTRVEVQFQGYDDGDPAKPVYVFAYETSSACRQFKVASYTPGAATMTAQEWDGSELDDTIVYVIPVQGHATGDVIYALWGENAGVWVEVWRIEPAHEPYKVVQVLDTTGHVGLDWVRAH